MPTFDLISPQKILEKKKEKKEKKKEQEQEKGGGNNHVCTYTYKYNRVSCLMILKSLIS